jgi:hypothetical protein
MPEDSIPGHALDPAEPFTMLRAAHPRPNTEVLASPMVAQL